MKRNINIKYGSGAGGESQSAGKLNSVNIRTRRQVSKWKYKEKV